MSNAFTSPAAVSWQSLLDEIVLAYSERRQALVQSAYTATDGKDVSAAAYWTTLQSWLETYCTSFVDHVSGPLNPAGTDFLYFTLATWRSAAGLNASGFRRKVEEIDEYSYGLMLAGTPKSDLIGPWIFEDLQKGFGALKWKAIAVTVTPGSGMIKSASTGIFYGTGLEAQAAADAIWESAEWTASDANSLTYAGRTTINDYVNYTATLTRRYCSYRATVNNSIPRVTQLWIRGDPPGPNSDDYFYANGDTRTEDVYLLMEEVTENTSTNVDFGIYAGDGKPDWDGNVGGYRGYTDHPSGLLKYNFTNA